MASIRQAVPEIQSWTPAIDARASENGSLFVLDESKNYVFDAKGPRSIYGSAPLSGGSLEDGLFSIQSLQIEKRVLVITGTGVYERRSALFDENAEEPALDRWAKIGTISGIKESGVGKFRWSSSYVGHGTYIAHPDAGVFKVLGDTIEAFNPPGMPEQVLAINESSGRLLIMNRYVVAWSGPFDANDLNPGLSGAGFQVINERVPGIPLALTSFQGGFIVWTTGGVLLAEFVGGDTVFRFDRVTTEQLMLNMNSWLTLPSGVTLVLTNQGLFENSPTGGMKPLTPIFNEYLRSILRGGSEYSVRMDYLFEYDQLFLQIMDSSATFSETYVLSLSLDKWGKFSEPHRGICRFSSYRGDCGYFDTQGVAQQFQESPFVVTNTGEKVGLESELILGYVRPADGSPSADVEFEIQEILVSAVSSSTEAGNLIEEDWGAPGVGSSYNIGFYRFDEDYAFVRNFFYGEDYNYGGLVDEDYNQSGTTDEMLVYYMEHFVYYIDPETLVLWEGLDFNEPNPVGIDDYNETSGDFDFNATPQGGVDTAYIEDWEFNRLNQEDEDWSGYQSFFNPVNYGLSVLSNLDGYEPDLTIPATLAVKKTKTDLWTLLSSGHNHRLKFTANQPDEKFHITQLEITVGYQGQVS